MHAQRTPILTRAGQQVQSQSSTTRATPNVLLYQTIAEHFETWFDLASAGQGDHKTPKPYVRRAFRKYLECGIFAWAMFSPDFQCASGCYTCQNGYVTSCSASGSCST